MGQGYHSVLFMIARKSAFKYATDDLELITENPMLGVTVKQPKSSRREVWTEEQFNFAYDNCSDPQLKLLISLMVALSSRIGECLALTWSDVYDNEDKHEPSYIRNYKELTYRTEKFIKETNGRGILKVFDQVRSTRQKDVRSFMLPRRKRKSKQRRTESI